MIEFEDVSFTYKSKDNNTGIKNINLSINEGELVVFCGASGCGKTTVTRLLNGIVPNYYEGELTGEILFDGKNVAGADIYTFSEKVGSVFQNPRSQFYNVDVKDELAFGCENMGLQKDEIFTRMGQAISELNINKLVEKSLFDLSGGEKQKIACASVSTMEPEIYVLDEPSSNLDIAAISDLRRVVAKWKREGKTIIIAEHRLYWLAELADKFVYMKNGYVERCFSRDEFLALSENERHNLCLRSLNPFGFGKIKPYMDKGEVLKIKDFCFAYKKYRVLNIEELTFPRNSVIAVLGDNGAGKSTFAKVLCGLEKHSKGTLTLDGCCMKAKRRIRNCYMVLQDVNHQLFAESVLDEVLLSMDGKDKSENEQSAEKILRDFNLYEKKELHPMSLSGGEKQRVVIASAIASDKPIVVFDEPTSGLDYENMCEVANCINDLRDMGKSIFLISHDPELLYRCCDYALFIREGKVEWKSSMSIETATKISEHFMAT